MYLNKEEHWKGCSLLGWMLSDGQQKNLRQKVYFIHPPHLDGPKCRKVGELTGGIP